MLRLDPAVSVQLGDSAQILAAPCILFPAVLNNSFENSQAQTIISPYWRVIRASGGSPRASDQLIPPGPLCPSCRFESAPHVSVFGDLRD